MDFFNGIVLGLVQGISEFLPISSSGHLLLAQKLLRIDSPGILLEVIAHLGTLIAVFYVFWKDWLAILKRPFSKPVGMLVIATIPAVIAALLLGDMIDTIFSGAYLALSFFMTTVVLFAAEMFRSQPTHQPLNMWDALVMGIMQAVALLPGLSRSGSTIAGGLVMGGKREEVAKFSFMMSAPAILGSLVFSLKDFITGSSAAPDINIPLMLVTCAVSAVMGVLAIKFMMRIINKVSLRTFAVYTAILGVIVFAAQKLQWF